MVEMKPCKCGNKNLYQITEKVGVRLWFSVVACIASPCDNYAVVSRYGFSRRHAKKRAIKAWNRRVSESND